MRFPAKTPGIIQRYYSQFTWCFSFTEKTIYLTFDDGPIPEVTEFVLSTLRQFNAQASFFCIGDNIAKHPAIFEQLLRDNHTIGNHSFHHVNGWKTPLHRYLHEVNLTEEQFEMHGVTSRKLFRPPYGKITRKQATALTDQGFSIIMWDVLSADYDQRLRPEQCTQRVVSHAQPGSIIVFHDSLKARKNLEYSLPKVLKYFTDRGYVFKGI